MKRCVPFNKNLVNRFECNFITLKQKVLFLKKSTLSVLCSLFPLFNTTDPENIKFQYLWYFRVCLLFFKNKNFYDLYILDRKFQYYYSTLLFRKDWKIW